VWQSPSFKAQLVQKSWAIIETIVHNTRSLLPLLSRLILSKSSFSSPLRPLLIIVCYLSSGPVSCHLFPPNLCMYICMYLCIYVCMYVCTYVSVHTRYKSLELPISLSFDHSKNVWWAVQMIKLLIMQLSPVSSHSHHSIPKHSLLDTADQASHSYKV
jgi:hypothetical protein